MTISATLAIFHSLCSRRHCRRRRGDSPQPSQALGRLHLNCGKYQGHSYWGHIGGVILSYTGSSDFQKVLSLRLGGPRAARTAVFEPSSGDLVSGDFPWRPHPTSTGVHWS